MSADLLHGDCREHMAAMAPDSVDAIVTDPPYGLEFMGKEWDKLDGGLPQEAVWKGRRGNGGSKIGDDDSNPAKRHHVGFGGKQQGFKRCTVCGKRAFSGSPCQCENPEWITEYAESAPSSVIRMQRWHELWAREAYRVLKPGGRLLAFGGTRTYHRMVCAIEDAGFVIEDTIAWLYGSGFPKHKSKLKPAHEPVVVAWKPAERAVPLQINACRIESVVLDSDRRTSPRTDNRPSGFAMWPLPEGERHNTLGRWPANVVLSHHEGCVPTGTKRVKSGGGNNHTKNGHGTQYAGGFTAAIPEWPGYADADGGETVAAWDCHPDCAVAALDAQSGERGSTLKKRYGDQIRFGKHGVYSDGPNGEVFGYGDTGGASRFFYCAKASRRERNAGLDGMPERSAGVGHRSTDPGEYIDFVYPAPAGIGEWLRAHRERSGLTVKDVAAHFPSKTGGLTGCVSNWEHEYNRPTPEQWWALKTAIGFGDEYDAVMTETRPVDRKTFDDRERPVSANPHPTVKPVALMRWLVRLVTPPGGTVYDPFLGSGTTGCAAMLEGVTFIGSEMNDEYLAIAERRIAHVAQYGERWLDVVHRSQRSGANATVDYGKMKVRRCNICGTKAKESGPSGRWPSCGHDDWIWVEQTDTPQRTIPTLYDLPLFAPLSLVAD